jgi:hypothetical protein
VGSESGEPIPLTDKDGNIAGYKKDKEGKTVLTRTDVAGQREQYSDHRAVLRQSGPSPSAAAQHSSRKAGQANQP